MLRKIVLRRPIVVVAAIASVAIIGYAAAGLVFAATRIASADAALKVAVSHGVLLNTTFRAIDSQFGELSSSSAFNAAEAISLVDQFVSSSHAAQATVENDDTALAGAAGGLDDQQWLTLLSRGNLDRESQRIAHARTALASARTVVSDYVADGQFFEDLDHALADLDSLSKAAALADITSAEAALDALKTHADGALQGSTSPGLPQEVHDLMVAFQVTVGDFGKLVGAMKAGDTSALAASQAAIAADAGKLSAYDFDKIGAEIDAFYKPLVARFNSEIAAAGA